MGYGIKEHTVLRILSAIDPFLFEMEGRNKVGLEAVVSAHRKSPFLGFRFVPSFLFACDAEQTFGRDVACCARALHLVA